MLESTMCIGHGVRCRERGQLGGGSVEVYRVRRWRKGEDWEEAVLRGVWRYHWRRSWKGGGVKDGKAETAQL